MKTGVILQARLRSSRLPRKVLSKIGGLTIFEHCLAALAAMNVDERIVATNSESVCVLAKYSARYGIKIMAGPDDDVLERFARVARRYQLTTIVRATADNPFVSSHYANRALQEWASARCDYFHYIDLPLGGGVEVFTMSALIAARLHSTSPYEREHVTPYMYTHPEHFRIRHARALKRDYQHIRITIDTLEDYRAMERLFRGCSAHRVAERCPTAERKRKASGRATINNPNSANSAPSPNNAHKRSVTAMGIRIESIIAAHAELAAARNG